MRSIKCMVTETSVLDTEEGIRYRGLSLFECKEQLPSAGGGSQMTPEAVFWLLCTGEVPTQEQADGVSREWAARAAIPSHVEDMLNNFPTTLHPMSQFSAAVTAMNSESEFASAYTAGLGKGAYWEPTYEDSMNLIAKLPTVASMIYRNVRYQSTRVCHFHILQCGANLFRLRWRLFSIRCIKTGMFKQFRLIRTIRSTTRICSASEKIPIS